MTAKLVAMGDFPKVIQLSKGWTFLLHSPRVGEIINPKGERQTSYFGFESEADALNFKAYIEQQQLGNAAVRIAERLATPYEVKAWNIPQAFIAKCVQISLQQPSP